MPMRFKRNLEIFYLDYWTPGMQYVLMAVAEFNKPMVLLDKTMWLAVLFTSSGKQVNYWVIGILYVTATFVFGLLGLLYYKSGAQKVTSSMGNAQNPELIKIKEELGEVLEWVREQKNGR